MLLVNAKCFRKGNENKATSKEKIPSNFNSKR